MHRRPLLNPDRRERLGVLEDVPSEDQLDPGGGLRAGAARGRGGGLLEVGDGRGRLRRYIDGEGRGGDGLDGEFHLWFVLWRWSRSKSPDGRLETSFCLSSLLARFFFCFSPTRTIETLKTVKSKRERKRKRKKVERAPSRAKRGKEENSLDGREQSEFFFSLVFFSSLSFSFLLSLLSLSTPPPLSPHGRRSK